MFLLFGTLYAYIVGISNKFVGNIMSLAVLKYEKMELTPQIKSPDKKINSLTKENDFRGLIKQESKQQQSTNVLDKAKDPKKVEDKELEQIKFIEEESSVFVDILETENVDQLGAEHFITPQIIELDESEKELLAESESVVPIVIPDPISSLSLAQAAGVITIDDASADSLVETIMAEAPKETISTTLSEAPKETISTTLASIFTIDEDSTLQFSKLPLDKQALLHNVQPLELPKGFALENAAMEFDVKKEPSNSLEEPLETTSASVKLSQFSKEMKMHLTVDSKVNAFSKDDISVVLKQSLASTNIHLAESTVQGQSVLSKMHLSNTAQDSLETQAFANNSELVLENEEMSSDLSGDNNFNSKNTKSNFSASGGVFESKSEDFFQTSFKDNLIAGFKGEEMPKPATQVSLSVIEALNSNATNGKKTIIINLFPQALGPVRVEVLSVAGKDGVRQIESIKFIADKRETLSILEAAKEKFVELTTKATNIKEETSLEFEMNQGDRGQKTGYFESSEEKDIWMSQFSDLTMKDDGMQVKLEDASEDIGYITEDSVNIKV